MPLEKSAGAVIFRRENNKIYYLLLNYPSSATRAAAKGEEEDLSSSPTRAAAKGQEEIISSSKSPRNYWDLPKGHIEKGEKLEETVRREVKEETGLADIKFTEGFKEWIKYFFKFEEKNIFKIVTFLLAETETKEVRISEEHIGYKWLPYDKALKQLTFKNAKEILKKANDFLSGKGI